MDSKQVLTAIDKHFTTLENDGYTNAIEMNILVQVMFIDEYYEYHREMETLTDCMTKKLNKRLQCIYDKSCLFRGNRFSELTALNHFIISDVDPEPEPEDDTIQDDTLHTYDDIILNTLYTRNSIINSALNI